MCCRGHISERNKYGQCLECVRENTRKWQKSNRLHSISYIRRWREENPEKYQALQQRQLMDKRNLSEKEREKVREKNRKWQKENPDKIRKINRIRKAYKRSAVPKWADKKAIKQIYDNCPEGMHVDHIIPIKGKLVTGLHVANNLQYLTSHDNLRKSNHYY